MRVASSLGTVYDGINDNLDRVSISQEMNNLHSVLHNANCHDLLAIVASMHHQRVGQPLNDWALSLAEPLG